MSKHTRSKAAEQRRHARHLVLDESYRDPIVAETVNFLDREQIANCLNARFGYVEQSAVQFTRGEIIADSRGEGSLQQRVPKFQSES